MVTVPWIGDGERGGESPSPEVTAEVALWLYSVLWCFHSWVGR
ncbi:MAG: hypothetical protein SWY16_05025 [Cyanobacteriota bacterium]|nr:hypothetical protein [Cyanobacteriota bacterium]